jgi:hypothetical protein
VHGWFRYSDADPVKASETSYAKFQLGEEVLTEFRFAPK